MRVGTFWIRESDLCRQSDRCALHETMKIFKESQFYGKYRFSLRIVCDRDDRENEIAQTPM